MGTILFISGIDTGVGKTIATGAIAAQLLRDGRDVITMKMVQTGNDGFSEDLDAHRDMMGRRFPEDEQGLTAPQIFRFPASPDLAGRLENRRLDLPLITRCANELASRHELVLVEGAGGLAVPLDPELTLAADYAAQQRWPLILVTSGKLGSINHTILSLEAARTRHIPLAAVIYNYAPDADPIIDRDTPRTIARYLQAHPLDAPIVTLPKVTPGQPLPELDLTAIFPKP